jgi:tetratricopeptide (TPR) repeat protein
MSGSHAKNPIGAPPEIARLLDSICSSAGFRRSTRLQRFLRYVVGHAIAEPNQSLKELQIAMDVFDRNAAFEPQVDPIVRVEAGRLRLRLTEYYAGPGQDDKVIIDISKGGYLPTFQVVPTGKRQPGGNSGSANPAAHRLYLKGRYFWGKRTAEGLAKAAEYYRRALAVDSAFGLAYLGIADCHMVSASFEFAAPSPMLAKAKAAAESVLRQGAHLAEALTTLACVKAFYERDWRGAETGFKQAIELDPRGVTSWQWYGMCCLSLGRLNEGLDALRTAAEHDPLSPMATTQLAVGLYLTRRYAEAEEACGLVLEMDPNSWPARYFLGLIYEQEGLFAQAMRELQHAEELSGGNALPIAAMAHAHARAGSPWDARRIVQKLEQESTVYVSPWALALVYVGLGKRDHALELLARSISERSPQPALFLSGEPRLDSLRSEPRFREMEQDLFGPAAIAAALPATPPETLR